MKKKTCYFENYSPSNEVGVDVNGVKFVIPPSSVGDNKLTVDIEPDALTVIQTFIATNHPYVVLTVVGDSTSFSNIGNTEVFLNPTNNGAATGLFQAVTVPSGLSCKALLIQVHDGSASDFASFSANPPTFHFSSTGNENGKDFIFCRGSLTIEISKESGGMCGYVRAEIGKNIVLMGV